MQTDNQRPFGNTIQKAIYKPLGCLRDRTDIQKCLNMTPDQIWQFITNKEYVKVLNAELSDIPELILEDTDPFLVRRTSDGLFLFMMNNDFGLTYYTISRMEETEITL